MKKHWVIVCGNKESFEYDVLEKECWGNIDRDILTRRGIEVGDKVVFYLAAEGFKGIFEVVKGPVKKEERDYSFGCRGNKCKSKIKLKKIEVWDFAKPMNEDLIEKFSFIKDKSKFGKYFWNKNLIRIRDDEFNLILKQPEIPPNIFPTEKALKNYIYNNWNDMDFGESLTIFKDGKIEGREYPVGTAGIIDFLCLDKNNDFVVLEFKKEKRTGRETIGQISEYIGWIEKKLAKRNQKVRGIILTPSSFPDALKHAAYSNSKISLMKINIMFKFNKV